MSRSICSQLSHLPISSESSFIIYKASYFNLPSSVISADFLIIFNVFLFFYSFCGLNLTSEFSCRYSDSKRYRRTAVFFFTWQLHDTVNCLKTILAIFTVIWHFRLISCSPGYLGLTQQCCFLCVFASSSFILLWGLNEPWQVRQSPTIIFIILNFLTDFSSSLCSRGCLQFQSTISSEILISKTFWHFRIWSYYVKLSLKRITAVWLDVSSTIKFSF